MIDQNHTKTGENYFEHIVYSLPHFFGVFSKKHTSAITIDLNSIQMFEPSQSCWSKDTTTARGDTTTAWANTFETTTARWNIFGANSIPHFFGVFSKKHASTITIDLNSIQTFEPSQRCWSKDTTTAKGDSTTARGKIFETTTARWNIFGANSIPHFFGVFSKKHTSTITIDLNSIQTFEPSQSCWSKDTTTARGDSTTARGNIFETTTARWNIFGANSLPHFFGVFSKKHTSTITNDLNSIQTFEPSQRCWSKDTTTAKGDSTTARGNIFETTTARWNIFGANSLPHFFGVFSKKHASTITIDLNSIQTFEPSQRCWSKDTTTARGDSTTARGKIFETTTASGGLLEVFTKKHPAGAGVKLFNIVAPLLVFFGFYLLPLTLHFP